MPLSSFSEWHGIYINEIDMEKEDIMAHPTNPVEGCADANPKTELPNDT